MNMEDTVETILMDRYVWIKENISIELGINKNLFFGLSGMRRLDVGIFQKIHIHSMTG